MACDPCGKNRPTINYLGHKVCPECMELLYVSERKIKRLEAEEKILHTVGNYTTIKPVWKSKIPYYITVCTGIAVIIFMVIERTVN